MIKLSEKEIEYLQKNIENVDEIIKRGSIRELLENLDMFINMNGFAPPDYYDYNKIGREAQKIYDGIYEKNCM